MMSIDERERKEAFEQGREVGRREGMGFDRIPPLFPWSLGAEFKFSVSWFESFFSYERDVLVELRNIQRARWLGRKAGVGSPSRLEKHQRAIEEELRAVRQAVDGELAEGRGKPFAVEATRVSPQRPDRVREYPDVDAFLDQDPRRGAVLGDRRDAAGADFGFVWGLENPMRRWEVTRWRISWLGSFEEQPTNEVYAIEVRDESWPGRKRGLGRVWLLGALPNLSSVTEALAGLQVEAMRERNSLVVAARAVRLGESTPSV